MIELSRDFCFVGSEYPVQVGTRDFALDLLFFHRGLNALVAIELKVERFEPEHLGKLNFYLEALDRDIRKPHEFYQLLEAPDGEDVPKAKKIAREQTLRRDIVKKQKLTLE